MIIWTSIRKAVMSEVRSLARGLLHKRTIPKWVQDVHECWQRGRRKRASWMTPSNRRGMTQCPAGSGPCSARLNAWPVVGSSELDSTLKLLSEASLMTARGAACWCARLPSRTRKIG